MMIETMIMQLRIKDLSKINFPDFQFSICFSDMI